MIAVLVTAWALLAAGFTAVALLRLARRGLGPSLSPVERGAVLLRPVDAPSAAELENLALTVDGVDQLIVSPRPIGAGRHLGSDPAGAKNRKLAHLKGALAGLPGHRAVLIADADVAVDGALVDALLSAIGAGAELAWAAPCPVRPGLSRGLLVQSVHSFEVLSVMALGAPAVCGKAMALGPKAVECLRALPDCIGEDLELSKALHERGLRVVQAGRARMPGPGHAPAARFTRWMQVLKAHRPALFPTVPLLFACTPVLLVAAQLTGERAAVAALVSLRLVLASALQRRPGLYLEWLAAEALLLACWLGALVRGGHVQWRGRTLQAGPNGALE